MLLTLITFLPLVFAGLLCCVRKESWVRPAALIFSLVQLAVSFCLFCRFDKNSAALQLVEKHMWVESFGIQYFLGIDGISLWLVVLTAVLTPIIILGSWVSIEKNFRHFAIHMMILETALIGSFLSIDAILFYVFFEASLIPMYFIVGIWGGKRRIYATIKFFIYTMFGSVLMLIAMISMMYMTFDQLGYVSSSLLDFYKLQIPFVGGEIMNPQTLMFFAFTLAFSIKVPLFPLHTWLPDAHVEAPTPGSVILAGVMLKLGTYGFLRFVIPLFPEATTYWGPLICILALIGIVYGALVAMVQPDIKKLVAYSSVSHMGYVVLGLFALNTYGVTGALYQMLNHGVSTGALFLLVGMIYERTHSREIKDYGGLASVMPLYTIAFVIVTLSSIAVPGTNGFIGEFLILFGTYLYKKEFAYVAVTGVIFGAAYMLWMVKRVFFGEEGPIVKEHKSHLHDLTLREGLVLAPLLVLAIWMGVYPQSFLSWSQTSIDHLMANKGQYQLTVYEEEAK
ncbi:MAG: NuoM family protein [Bdellovibrionales bacterium]